MAKSWAKKLYNSTAWKKCRASYIAKVFGLCEGKGCGKPGYIVDHIIELSPDNINDIDITLNHNNLQYLCIACHNTKTFAKHSATAEGLMFDEQGNLVEGNAVSSTKRIRSW